MSRFMTDGRCYFCGKPACASADCERHDLELQADYAAAWWRDWRMAIWTLLRERCHGMDLYYPGSRWFYTFKGLVCLLLFRLDLQEAWHNGAGECAAWDIGWHGGEESGQHWTALEIGYGVFKNWQVHIYTDSCP